MTDDLQANLLKKQTICITLSNYPAGIIYRNLHSIYCSQETKL